VTLVGGTEFQLRESNLAAVIVRSEGIHLIDSFHFQNVSITLGWQETNTDSNTVLFSSVLLRF
jgi:hypothetical protein